MTYTGLPLSRRPIAVADCYSGDFDKHPKGLSPEWGDDDRCVGWLIEQAVMAKQWGAKRLMMPRCGGKVKDQFVPGPTWAAMTKRQRFALEAASEVIECFPFMGATFTRNPRSVEGWTRETDSKHALAFGTIHARAQSKNIEPWRELGTRTFAIDSAANRQWMDHFLRVARALIVRGPFNVTLIGEALPMFGNEIHTPAIETMPWLAAHDSYLTAGGRPERTFDPDESRVIVWIENTRELAEAGTLIKTVEDYHARGFIIALPINQYTEAAFARAVELYEASQ